MYVNMNEINFKNINEIYIKVREIFKNVKSQKDASFDELVKIYSNDPKFLNELNVIEDSLSEIAKILAPFETLENEYCLFLNVQRMIYHVIKDIKLFISNISFIDELLINFFALIHQKLENNDDEYKIHLKKFISFLEEQNDFFYTRIYPFSGEYEDAIIRINNLLLG
ncbi:hypothetical protein [Methanobrevibacter sp.]